MKNPESTINDPGFFLTILRMSIKIVFNFVEFNWRLSIYLKKIILLLFLLIVFSCYFVKAQPINGSGGLLNIPNAEMRKDGTFIVGANYLPAGFTSSAFPYNTGNYYFNITFLPFLEVTYRLTLMQMKFQDKPNFNEDRSFGLRLRILKEKKYIPAIILGGDDIYSSSGIGNGNQYFGSSYIVGTKTIEWNNNLVSLNFGAGFNSFEKENLNGYFGGISYSPQFFKLLNLKAEFDTKAFNFGASLLLFDSFFLYGFVNNCEHLVGGIAYHIYLY